MARDISITGDELYRRIQLALLLRVIMVTFLLVATVVIHFTRTPSFLTAPLVALYILTGVTFFITLITLFALRWTDRVIILAYQHIIWETVFVSALIYITTGKYESIFSFLYLIVIIVSGILLYRKGAFFAAVLGSLSYGAVLAGLEEGIIQDLVGEYRPLGWYNVIYNFFINLAAMFGMAFFSSYLTEKLRMAGDELQETLRDRDALEALNDHIVHSLSSGLITLDMKRRITSYNEAAESITGISMEKALGAKFTTIFPMFEDRPVSLKWKSESEESRFEITWKRSDDERQLEFRVSPLKDANREPAGTIVILDDVTEMKRMESRLRKADRLAAVGTLAAGMAHEIRNPLASISGSIQMLDSDTKIDETNSRLMKIVMRETDRLNRLITDFLLYARPTPRSIKIFDLGNLMKEVVEMYKHRQDMNHNLKWDLSIENGIILETDHSLIEQVLWNLLKNAEEATSEGDEIKIHAASISGDGKNNPARVRIEVGDSGPGIPQEYQDKIFDPFFTTKEKGTGLGLSTVYRIVESLEGTMWVESREGEGSRFIIELPLSFEEVPAKDEADKEVAG